MSAPFSIPVPLARRGASGTAEQAAGHETIPAVRTSTFSGVKGFVLALCAGAYVLGVAFVALLWLVGIGLVAIDMVT